MRYGLLRSVASYLDKSARMMAKPDVIFVLGQPGAGKGTQCSKIVNVSTGDRRRRGTAHSLCRSF